jgi:hypothetical protein
VTWLRHAWPLVATFAAGGAVGAVGMYAYGPRRVERTVVVERRVEPSAEGERSAVAQRLPSAPPVASPAPRSPPLAPAQTPIVSAGSASRDVAGERKLLDVARHALDEGDGARAMDAVSLHERRYANGALMQEREAMAIRALALIGRAPEARARADRFRARFPSSLLLPAIESTLTARGGEEMQTPP